MGFCARSVRYQFNSPAIEKITAYLSVVEIREAAIQMSSGATRPAGPAGP
jgi:hypothetical protein